MKRMKLFPLTASIALCATAGPATAQIIATSIPKDPVTSQEGATEKRFAFHAMGSPFAKWRINSYYQEPAVSDNPTLQNTTTTDSSSKFIFAGEGAFKASRDITVGVGGWFNELGRADLDFVQIDLLARPGTTDPLVLSGTAPYETQVSEIHGNVFYRDVGVQAGLVRTRFRQKGLRAGTLRVRLDRFGNALPVERLPVDDDFDGDPEVYNNWDAFLVYKKSFSTGKNVSWGVSLGSGLYHDDSAKSTKFSGFATATVEIYKGLGLDASFWYIGAQKQTAARRDFEDLLEETVKTNMSRFTVGIGYTFSR